VVTTWMDDCL